MALNPRQVRAIADWKNNYPYETDMEVFYMGRRYRCVSEHISSGSFEIDGANWESEISAQILLSLNYSGFDDSAPAEIAVDNSSRTFSIIPLGSNFAFWFNNEKIIKNAESVVFPDLEWVHFFYYEANGTLTSSQALPSYFVVDVAYLYWSQLNSRGILFNNMHTLADQKIKKTFERVFGVQCAHGLRFFDIESDQSGDVDSNVQFGCTDGAIIDFDLIFNIQNNTPQQLSPILRVPIFYRVGANAWSFKVSDDFPLIYAGTTPDFSGTRIAYNLKDEFGNFSLEEVPHTECVLVHFFATTAAETPIVGILGQEKFTANIVDDDITPYVVDVIESIPFQKDIKAIGTVAFQTRDNYTNTPKARIRHLALKGDYLDMRGLKYVS